MGGVGTVLGYCPPPVYRGSMEINGLPLHPLVVHAAVIFGPDRGDSPRSSTPSSRGSTSGCAGRCSRSRCWRPASIVVAYLSGNDFLDSRPELGASPQVQTHEQRAENLLWATLVFGVVAIGAAVLHPRQGGVRIAVSAVLMLSAAAVLVLVVLTGDAGAAGRVGRSEFSSTTTRCARSADRRNDSTRNGSASPAATASSSPHSGSSVPWVQPRGQSSVISSRSGKASISRSGLHVRQPERADARACR